MRRNFAQANLYLDLRVSAHLVKGYRRFACVGAQEYPFGCTGNLDDVFAAVLDREAMPVWTNTSGHAEHAPVRHGF